jgi:hypothetical protein
VAKRPPSAKTMSQGLNATQDSEISSPRYQLSMERKALQKRRKNDRGALEPASSQCPDAIAIAFAINGKTSFADFCGSSAQSGRFWARQLTAATVASMEAPNGASQQKGSPSHPEGPTESLEQWIKSGVSRRAPAIPEVCPGVWLRPSKKRKSVLFNTVLNDGAAPVFHQCIIALD